MFLRHHQRKRNLFPYIRKLIDLYGTFVFRGWLAMLSGICTAGAQIVFGVCIINYNRKVREMTETPQA